VVQGRARKPAASESVLIRHDNFLSRLLGNRRTIRVCLPPGYANNVRHRYPVLYLHDGQNLFDAATAANSVSWEADRTANRLMRAGRIQPLIMVGIDHSDDRLDEYTIHRDPRERAGGKGQLYGRFVLREVKPFIDAHYRTRPGRDHTAVAGSSLGGLVSLTMARDYHDDFALCGLVSASLWWCRCKVFTDLSKDRAWMKHMRFWVDMGTKEGGRDSGFPLGITQAHRLIKSFNRAGLVAGTDYHYLEVAGGEHNEAAWAARFDELLRFFFGT
jgi:predicted alpha/beta superfamily hydrolase